MDAPFPFPFGLRDAVAHVIVETGSGGSTAPLWVSVASACFAGVAVAVTVWRELNDRSRISVSSSAGVDRRGPHIEVLVVNRGRQPVTIGPVTLLWDLDGELESLPLSGEIALGDPTEQRVLAAGASVSELWPIPRALPLHEKTPVRAAAYMGETPVYSPARPLFASLIRLAPKTKAVLGLHDEALDKSLSSRRIVARWKIWRPRHLRVTATVDRETDRQRAALNDFGASLPKGLWGRPRPGRGTWTRPDS
ncbi:MAG: hypothetical protein QOE65_1834 [Solirubrobacteraceae bacterium]|jgi:hypothetical protein|nr:hypothetical protein [Solirubrobacteraceae bacterium]